MSQEDYVFVCKKCGDEIGIKYEPPPQEPVAWVKELSFVTDNDKPFKYADGIEKLEVGTPLYTAPKQLSDEEAYEIFELEAMKNRDYDWKAGVRAILKKASEK